MQVPQFYVHSIEQTGPAESADPGRRRGSMGIDQPKVSALLNGRLTNFSSERLMRLLTRLGQDIEIVVRTKPRRRQRGRIRVVDEARA